MFGGAGLMAIGTNAKKYSGRAFQSFIFNATDDEAFASSKTCRKKNCYKKMELLDKQLLLFFMLLKKTSCAIR